MREIILIGNIECLRSHRTVREETLSILRPEPDDVSELPKLCGWFKNYGLEDIREGDELKIALVDGRKSTVIVRRVKHSAELSAPIILFDGDSSLQ